MMRRTVVYLVAVANTTFKARPISYKNKKRKEKTDKQAKLIVGESKLAPLYPVSGHWLKRISRACVLVSWGIVYLFTAYIYQDILI